MYEGTPRKLFARYAVPQMVGLLFNSVYLIVDGLFIGNRLGRDALAAAAVSVPLLELLIALAMALASGAGVLISGALGRGERAHACRTLRAAVGGCLAFGLAVCALGNLLLDPLARALGSTPAIHADATRYLWFLVTFAPFQLLSFLLGGLVRCDGRPRLAMCALAAGSLSNVVLDYVFLYPLDMGIGGAALATALGPIFSVLLLLPHFLRRRGQLSFPRGAVGLRPVGRILVLGFPSFIMEFTLGVVTAVYNFAIVRYGYGELGLAAYLVIGYLMLLILTVFLGLSEGLQPVLAYLLGTGQESRAQALRRFAARVLLAVGLLCYGLSVVGSRGFFSLFSPGDEGLIAFARERSLVYFCGFAFAGYNILMICFWQAGQRTRRALVVSLSRSLLWPPLLALTLPLLFGRESLWLCHSLSEGLTAALALASLRGQTKGGREAGGLPPA